MSKNGHKSAAQATCPIGLIYTRSTYTGLVYPGLIYTGLIYTGLIYLGQYLFTWGSIYLPGAVFIYLGQYPPTNKRYATATLLLTSVIMGGSASAPVL